MARRCGSARPTIQGWSCSMSRFGRRAPHYYKGEANYQPGTFFAGGGEQELPSDDAWGAIRALEATTGRMVWEFRLHSPPWAGVLATAGGLVFSGSDEGN